MEIAIQIIANDNTVGSDTVEDLKEYNNQSLATQAKKGKQLVSMMPSIKKAFNLLGDDIVELTTENDALKNKKDSYDRKWLEESKNEMLKQIDDEKRAKLIMSRLKKQMNRQQYMAFMSFKKLQESEIDGIVSKRDKLQDLHINQLKLEVYDTY